MKLSKISTPGKRKKLEQRMSPYFELVEKNFHIGFRKNLVSGSWVTKYHRKLHTLGAESDYTFEEAVTTARKWVESIKNIADADYSVRDAVIDYSNAIPEKGTLSARKAAATRLFNKLPENLLNTPLRTLSKNQVTNWRNSLVTADQDNETTRRSKDTANRILSIFKAALNLAFELEKCTSQRGWEIKAFKSVAAARTVFLTTNEIHRLLDVTTGHFHNLIVAAILTGARYGELCNIKKKDFDLHYGTLRLNGKTGARDTELSSKAIEFLTKQARLKKPDSYLLPKNDIGNPWSKSDQFRPMQAAVKAAALPADTVFYSLRHFHAARVLGAKTPPLQVARNLGTSVKMLEKNYDKQMKGNYREFLDEVELLTLNIK